MKNILLLSLLLSSSIIPLGQSKIVRNANETYYVLGTHLEAEDFAQNLTVINNNKNASGKKAIDAGSNGAITYKVNLETAGNYRLAIGYYSGGSAPKIKLNINNKGATTYDIDVLNGWCKDTNRLPLAKDFNVELNQGENTIYVAAAGPYVNFDYIAIFNIDAEYEDAEMYAHLKADGKRIQAEWCRDVAGQYSDKNIQIKDAGSQTDGYILAVDDDFMSRPGWIVNADEAGEYIMQIAYYGANNLISTYKWNINGNDYSFTFPSCPANWNYDAYSSKAEFKINLNQGENVIYYSYNKQNYADFDWFRIFKRETKLDQKIEAEDFVYGDVSVQKSNLKYPFVSNHVAELAQGNISFDIDVVEAGKYSLYVSSYTDSEGAYQNLKINNQNQKIVYQGDKVNGWIDNALVSSLNRFNIDLNEGKNTIKITKGEDDISFNYVDLDYFYISKGAIDTSPINLNVYQDTEKLISDFISLTSDYELISSNEKVLKIEGDKIKAVSGGKVNLVVKYNYQGFEFKEVIPVNVSKEVYQGNDVIAKDTVKQYTGAKVLIDVEMPEGWSFTQEGNQIDVGTYDVKVIFSHPNYEDIIQNVSLTISKAVYTGNDLIVEDMTYEYDGNIKSILASAPVGWEIEYENNSQVEEGSYQVIVRFIHKNYETVEKVVTLTIQKSFPIGAIVAISSAVVVSALCVVLVLLKRKKGK